MRESVVQKKICEHLRKKGVFFWRNNNQPTYDPKLRGGYGGYRSQGEYALSGAPDIIAIAKDGRFVGIEVKSPSGRISEDQQFFADRCYRYNAEYHIVRNVADVDEVIHKTKLL